MDALKWIAGALGLTALAGAARSKEAGGAARAKEAGFGFEKRDSAHGILTPGRQDSYERAMRQKGTKEQFYAFAELFDGAGLPEHARTLRARGDSRTADAATHERRREVIRKAYKSRDPMKVEEIAHIAETSLGMTLTAEKLREYAKGLREANSLSVTRNPSVGVGEEIEGPRVVGDGGTLASVTRMAGESKLCNGMGAECLVHSTGGNCTTSAKDVSAPPPVEEMPEQDDPFKRQGNSF